MVAPFFPRIQTKRFERHLPGSMAKLTHGWEKDGGCGCPHHNVYGLCLSSDRKGEFYVCCLLSARSPVHCGPRLVGVNPNKTGEQKGTNLISSGSWSGCRQRSPLALLSRLWPIALHRKLYVNASVIPTTPPSVSLHSAWHHLLLVFQDLIEFYKLPFDGVFSWIF